MKKTMLTSLCLLFICTSYGQFLEGIVLDRDSKKKLAYATIYINETSAGTFADQKGCFKLDISKYPNKPITVSAVGYYSKTIERKEIGSYETISLKPKVYNIDETVIESNSLVKQRKNNLRIFKEEFLGTTRNSWKCEILNENDITFNYNNDDDTLKAFIKNPLKIHNKALGFYITYYMDVFEYYKDKEFVFFVGNFLFEEDSLLKSTIIRRNREETYIGSRMHFLRSLWANVLPENGFEMYDEMNKKIQYKDIVIEDNNHNKYIDYKGTLFIYFEDTYSKVIISKLIFFGEDGSHSLEGIWWTGPMGAKRIADWLPTEYNVEK